MIKALSTASNNDFQVALKTIPVILSNGKNKLVANALLNDGSTKSYGNSDVAFHLGTHGKVPKIQVRILNDKLEILDGMSVELMVESFEYQRGVPASTVKQVTGRMKVINWNKHKDKSSHTKGIEFPEPSRKKYIDTLLGIDYPQFHTSIKEVKRKNGDRVAKHTPLVEHVLEASYFYNSADKRYQSMSRERN